MIRFLTLAGLDQGLSPVLLVAQGLNQAYGVIQDLHVQGWAEQWIDTQLELQVPVPESMLLSYLFFYFDILIKTN